MMLHKALSTLVAAASLAVLAGCANPAVITLNDGRQIQTLDTPRYDSRNGFYTYKQLDGKKTQVNKDEVKTIKEL